MSELAAEWYRIFQREIRSALGRTIAGGGNQTAFRRMDSSPYRSGDRSLSSYGVDSCGAKPSG